MKSVLFVTSHGYLPQKLGGSEASTHELCKALMSRSVKVAVLSSLMTGDFLWFKNRIKSKILGSHLVYDKTMGYSTYRVWDVEKSLSLAIDLLQPDWVVIQAGQCIKLAKKALTSNANVVVYVRDVDFNKHGGDYFSVPNLRYITNSQFTADKLQSMFGISSTPIPPMVDYNCYKVKLRGNSVVFVCPFPEKGVVTATALAKACPHIPFVFVESWTFTKDVNDYLDKEVKPLKNITVMHKQLDMKKVYSMAKVIIIPSLCEEAWGRIASEAQVSGIPVVARQIGGLPESVGKGGVLMHKDAEILEWQRELNKLWENEAYYQQVSNAALDYSNRQEITIDSLTDKFIKALL